LKTSWNTLNLIPEAWQHARCSRQIGTGSKMKTKIAINRKLAWRGHWVATRGLALSLRPLASRLDGNLESTAKSLLSN